MTTDNLYEILGVDKSATEDEIKKAFKRSAQKNHPDKKDGCKEKFQALKSAYEVLSNPSSRKHYDETGSILKNSQATPDDLAKDALKSMFSNLLNTYINSDTREITAMIKTNLNETIESIDNDLFRANNDLNKLNKKINNVSISSGTNLYRIAVESKIEQTKKIICDLTEGKDIAERVISLLDHYSEVEPEKKDEGSFSTTKPWSTELSRKFHEFNISI